MDDSLTLIILTHRVSFAFVHSFRNDPQVVHSEVKLDEQVSVQR